MADVSNKTIVGLLAVALVITVVGTVVSVTKLSDLSGQYTYLSGAATTGTGTAEVTVQAIASLSIDDSNITFPAGYYNASCTSGVAILNYTGRTADLHDVASYTCWLNTSGGEIHGNILNTTNGELDVHAFSNNGTSLINVSAASDQKNASDFLCDGDSGSDDTCEVDNATVSITAFEIENSSCSASPLSAEENFLNLNGGSGNSTGQGVTICQTLDYADANDAMNVTYSLQIPKTALGGSKTMTVTYTATAK